MFVRTFFVIILSIATAHAKGINTHPREEKNNIASVFLGSTTTQAQIRYTDGLEYHRIISFPFGVAVIYENTPKNIENRSESELYSLLAWNLPHDLIIGAGPGWRFKKSQPSVFLTRLKLGYIFLLPGNIEIMPNANYDFNPDVRAEWVTGISIGKQF